MTLHLVPDLTYITCLVCGWQQPRTTNESADMAAILDHIKTHEREQQ